MESTGNTPQGRSVRQPVLLGLFAGVAVGVGYLLAGVPGVELMTLVTALAGLALGIRAGAGVGGLAALVYSLGSPYGVPVPLILTAQVLGMAAAGVIGGLLGSFLRKCGPRRRPRMLAAGLAGVTAAVVFDVLTNLAIALAYGTPLAAVAAMAVPMFLIHVAVNAAVFVLVVPTLAPRLSNLARGSLVGRGGTALALVVLVCGPAAAATAQEADSSVPAAEAAAPGVHADAPDTTGTPPVERRLILGEHGSDPGPAEAFGWRRPLWHPFAPTALVALDWWSPRVTVVEAGVGGPAVILGEAVTSPMPLVDVDGVPWTLGHAVADDPWLIPTQGVEMAADQWYAPVIGGTAGRLRLRTVDRDPDRAVSAYRGAKGPHETYMRGFHLLTPARKWRIGFFFEEIVDREAYNYSDDPDYVFSPEGEFTGHGGIRQSRTRLERILGPQEYVRVEATTARKTRDDVPAWQAEHQETWDRGVSTTWRGARDRLAWNAIVHWRDRDVQWGDKPTAADTVVTNRKLEVLREGVVLDLWSRPEVPAPAPGDTAARPRPPDPGPDAWRRTGPGLRLEYSSWYVHDSGDTMQSLPPNPGALDGDGREVQGTAILGSGLVGFRWQADLGGSWDEWGGATPVLVLAVGEDREDPRWHLSLARDGRAPRSDELLTPVERAGGTSGTVQILPNPDLVREESLRAGLRLKGRVLGFDLAADAAARRLRDGITWVPLEGDPDSGRWQNDLTMDSSRITASIGRQGRLLGWGRLLLEGTWQTFDEKQVQAAFLPPEQSLRLNLFWENHFFQEDGILQLGLVSTLRGEMDDPWDVSRGTRLPSRTVHDLLAGFRLVGAHLSIAVRNLTDERTRLSGNTWSSGREIDLRLHWSFHY